jgi:hypothetical protein
VSKPKTIRELEFYMTGYSEGHSEALDACKIFNKYDRREVALISLNLKKPKKKRRKKAAPPIFLRR